ncbi:hypothetical protein TNCV_3541331 [Trichonephila clavipes]|nr:hypothetical protein TNCV_3541331 [Trichonephila clavipes]
MEMQTPFREDPVLRAANTARKSKRNLASFVQLTTPLAPEKYVEKLQAWIQEIHHMARERIGMASGMMKTRHDARVTGHDFHQGDKVWLRNPKRHRGLSVCK